MNLTRIEYFLTAAEYMNFTKAASVLYISQPSLSKQIALLEEEVDAKLFTRSKKGLQLTRAGKEMYAEFIRLLPEINMAVEKVHSAKNGASGSLKIGFVEAVSIGDTVTKMIWDFTNRMKDIDLFVERCTFKDLRNKILDGSLDVAFTLSPQINRMRDIECVEIEQRKRYIILSINHPLAKKDHVGFEDLKDEVFVLIERDKALVTYDDITGACRAAGYTPKIRYAPNNISLLDYIELSSCVAFLDKSFTENRKDRLKCFPTDLDTRFSLVCIWKQGNENPLLEEFLKELPEKQLTE